MTSRARIHPHPRTVMIVSLLAVALTAAAAPYGASTAASAAASHSRCAVSRVLVPSCGVWWGVAPGALTAVPKPRALAGFEATIGRRVDIVHLYHVGGTPFPTRAEIAMARQPGHRRLLLINWKPESGHTWAAVAAGAVDAELDAEARHLKAEFPERFFLAIHHEPEDEVNPAAGSGHTAADYAAMVRHVIGRLRAAGVANAVTVQIYMGYSGWGAKPWFPRLYPGDQFIDWIGYDPYASAAPTGRLTGDFARMANRTSRAAPGWPGFYTWASTGHPGKPLMLAEWGVFEDATHPAGKPAFYRTVLAGLASYRRLKALVYFDSPNAPRGDTRVDSTSPARAAYRALGSAEVFRVPVPAN